MDPPPRTSGERPPYHRPRKLLSAVAVASTLAALAVAILRWRPSRIEIQGESMMPTLMPGDWAMAVAMRRYRPGDVVVVEHPGRPGFEIVKRLGRVPGERIDERVLGPEEFWVVGDREDASTDSRHFGPVRREHLQAKVLLVFWPKERRRRLG